MKKPSKKSLLLRKEKLETRLANYGLDNAITDIGVLDETQYNFVDPTQAAERLLILLAVSYAAYNFSESEKVMNWLKKENIWPAVSDREKEFFRNPDPEEEEKQGLSWRFETAYMLAWALGKVSVPPDPRSECGEKHIQEFLQHIPPVGSPAEEFLFDPQFRTLADISDENHFYEIATVYYKNIRVLDKENTSSVHEKASFERCVALAWLRSSGSGSDWDTIVAKLMK
jgi:hypothetical protein